MGSKRGVVAFTPVAGASSSSRPASSPDGGDTSPATLTVSPGQPLPTRQASTAVPSSAYPTLRLGSKGPSVVWLQQHLGITADGDFGHGTQASVIAYQQHHGLTPDGVVGPMTWNVLRGGDSQAA